MEPAQEQSGRKHASRRRWRDGRVLVIACGAIVPEIQAVARCNGLSDIAIRALPASYHNRPEKIVPGIERLLGIARGRFETIFVAYADCGTGGALDDLLVKEGIERLPGAHCYQFFTGMAAFEAAAEADLRSFYLTDFLARHFDRLVWQGLGLDRHPELRDAYFSNYERVVYLSQAPTAELLAEAERAASRLGLALEHRHVGYGDLTASLQNIDRAKPQAVV